MRDTFQPGDRVRLTQEYGGRPIGFEFTVDTVQPVGPQVPEQWPGEQVLYSSDVHGVFARRVERVVDVDGWIPAEPEWSDLGDGVDLWTVGTIRTWAARLGLEIRVQTKPVQR